MFLLWVRQLSGCGDRTPASVPPPTKGRASPTNAPVFPPSSYRVLHGSIYSFPLVRYSCLLSAGVLHALLCLKVYSWCIHGERCTPCPPTPLPSCSSLLFNMLSRLVIASFPRFCQLFLVPCIFIRILESACHFPQNSGWNNDRGFTE